MKKIIRNNRKNDKGITLIALVVTIIVLLILAAISIGILMGENGVIQKAKESKEETIKAQEKEYITLAYQNMEMQLNLSGQDITADRLENELKKYDENVSVKEIDETQIGNKEIVINRDGGPEYGEITYKETEHIYVVPLVIEPQKTRYTIIYNANGGTGGPTKQTKIEGTDLIITTEVPTKSGYTFSGWSESQSGATADYFGGSSYTKDANATLYAVWDEAAYSITYNLNGGTVTGNPAQYRSNTATFSLKNPTRKGYTFIGWTGTGLTEETMQVIIPQGSTGNREYTANWESAGFVDETAPTVGSVIGKLENENGENYVFDTWTDKNVYIEKVDGSDGESGHKKTTYTVKKDNEIIYEDIENPITLTEEGTYEIVVKTEDIQGNIATSNPYIVKISRDKVELTLKHNDASGADYELGTWTKDDLYGEITLDTSDAEKTVEKYQYSYDRTNWYDISEEQYKQTNFEYTSTFPLAEGKPDWLSNPTGDYVIDEENNMIYIHEESYGAITFEIDLTDYPNEELEVVLDMSLSGGYRGYGDVGIYDEEGKYEHISKSENGEYIITIEGGKKYNLVIDYDSGWGGGICEVYSIKLKKAKKEIMFYNYQKQDKTVNFLLKDTINKEIYIRANYEENENSGYSANKSIKIDKTAPRIESTSSIFTTATIVNTQVKIKEADSGLQGYYISTEDIEPIEGSEWLNQTIKDFTIEGLSAETTYYLWVKDNVGNVSKKYELIIGKANYSIDNRLETETLREAIAVATDGSIIKLLNDYKDFSVVVFDKNVTLDIQGYTLSRDEKILINNEKTVEVKGTGKITANDGKTIINKGILTLSGNVTIENSNNIAIYTEETTSITNINDNVKLIGYYQGIENDGGIVNINGGTLETTGEWSNCYGIYNKNSSSKTYIKDGEVKGYYGIYNYNSEAIVEMTGGKVVGTGADGISAYGITNIYGGRIEGKTYGVYSNSPEKVTIGRQENDLSTTSPAVYGGNYGVYMSNETYSFNFYNGVIISNTKESAYRGKLIPRQNHMPYTYFDEEVEQKYCTILIPGLDKIKMEATPTEYTNENVTVKITYPYITGITKQYSEDYINWKDTNNFAENLIVAENKTIYARILNKSGTVTDENQIVIDNIDKEKPVAIVTPTETNYIVTDENDTVDLNITIKATDTGVSGLDVVQYGWAKEGEEVTFVDFANEITIDKNNLKIGQYNLYLNVTDKAGNEAELKQIRYNVKYEEPVCKIGDTKYLTIQEAVEACSKEAGETQTTIEMLKSTDEEFNTYEGQNIILDLKGYTIGSSNVEKSICTNNAILQIIDSSTEKIGKLESLNYIAIDNKGTIIIGDNSTSIEPNIPTIYGQKIGIKNEGKFEFYDGKIQGVTPIRGNVTKTPDGYGPVSTNYSNGITTIQLGIVTEYVARIDWVYYTTLQDAINATRTGKSDIDTVTIIKNIQLSNIAEINATKDMKLDLNGYELTILSTKDRVINNYGNLEIIDSSEIQTGKIKTEFAEEVYVIYNRGNLVVTGGTISSGDYYSTCGIYSEGGGNVTIAGGTISASYGIYNNGTGNVKIKEGLINAFGYGIYNNNIGDVIVNGGEIDSVDYDCYGIYNNGTGNIVITGGKIYSDSNTTSVSAINYGIYNVSSGNITIEGGTVGSASAYSDEGGICNLKDGNITITGGTITQGIINNSGNIKILDGTVDGFIDNESGDITIDGGTITNVDVYDGAGISNNSGDIIINGGTISNVFDYSGSNMKSYAIYNYIGNVIINGGTISNINPNANSGGNNHCYGIYNDSIGRVIINGGTVTSEDRDSYGIYNNETGTITMTGGTVSCNNYGIYNYSTGRIEIIDGTISGERNGIKNYDKGTIIIGVKESEAVSQETPYIQSQYTEESLYYGYGIENKNGGILEFYNGKIEGTNGAINGNIDYIREGYEIRREETETSEIIYLVEQTNNEYVAQIGESKYYNLQEAIDSIGEEEKTIDILKSFELKKPNLKFNKNVTLNVNGYEITNRYYYIENTGNLTIEDLSENQQGKINCINTRNIITNKDSGIIKITGGVLNNNNGEGIYNLNNGSITITGGTIEQGISNYSGNIIVNEGTINKGIVNENGQVTINGGTVASSSDSYSSCGISNYSGNLIINGGTIKGTQGIYNDSTGNIEIRGGTILAIDGLSTGCGIENDGNVIITGGIISCTSRLGAYGIDNNGTGTVAVNGGIINVTSSENAYNFSKYFGIANYSTGNIIVTAGTVTCNANKYAYGIYNDGSGSITIGIKGDNTISKEEPLITGKIFSTATDSEGYGIYNTTGSFNFYDGKIEGTTKALHDTLTEKEVNTELDYNEDETILTLTTELKPLAQIGDVTYTILQEAIDSAGTDQATIKLLRSVTYTAEAPTILIPDTKNIILDLNNYSITSTSQREIIENEGILEIVDTSEEQLGAIITTGEITLSNRNSAQLTITGVTIENRTGLAIENEGELIINGKSVSGITCGINNLNSGTIIVKGGTISGNTFGIKSTSIGSITINEGTISCSKNNSSDIASGAIYNEGTGNIGVNGGIIDGTNGIYNSNTGDITITEGTVNGSDYGIYNSNTGSITISGGSVNGNGRSSCGICNEGTGNIRVNGGTVSSTGDYGGTSYTIINRSTGNIEIIEGTISGYYGDGILNIEGNLTISGGTITVSGSYAIRNRGNLTMTGGTVTGSWEYGIDNDYNGNITITGGTINGYSYGIYNDSSESITIGIKGNEIFSQEEPYIYGGEYGIYSPTYYANRKIIYYDGKIEGSTKAIDGIIEEIEDSTELLITKDSTEIIQLQEKETNVASVNGVEYDSIQKAIEACGTTESIVKILRDAEPGATIIIDSEQNITIDLNGYIVKNYTEMTNYGTLKITDTSTEKTGKLIGLTGIVVKNIGTIELNGGTIADSGYGVYNDEGIFIMNEGNIINNTYGVYYNNSDENTSIINGGTISSNTYGIYINNGIVNINNINITECEYGIYCSGTVNVRGYITGGEYGIYNSWGTTKIKEGSHISSNIGVSNSSYGTINIGDAGTMNSSSPIIIGEEYGLVNESVTIVNMYDGQIKGKAEAIKGYITNTETGYAVATKTEGEYMIDYLALAGTVSTVAQVNGIDFSNLQSAINSVIGDETQTITLTNGIITTTELTIAEGQDIILDMNGKTISSDLDVTITNNGTLTIIDSSGNNVAKILSTVGTAIVNTGTLTLGQDDGTVVQDLINIEGTTYGIQSSGTLNFYDGTINGASAINGSITSRATGYVIRTTTVNEKERYYLST